MILMGPKISSEQIIEEAFLLWDVPSEPFEKDGEQDRTEADQVEHVLVSNLATWTAAVAVDMILHTFLQELADNLPEGIESKDFPLHGGGTLSILRDGNAFLVSTDGTEVHFWETPDDPEVAVQYDEVLTDTVLDRAGRSGELAYEVPTSMEEMHGLILQKAMMEVIELELGADVSARILSRYAMSLKQERHRLHDLQKRQESWLKEKMLRYGWQEKSFLVLGCSISVVRP